jgi:hypothetical protein
MLHSDDVSLKNPRIKSPRPTTRRLKRTKDQTRPQKKADSNEPALFEK